MINRWREQYLEFLKEVPHKVGAEIGVYKGDNAVSLLSGLDDLELLYCVDPWEEYDGYVVNNTPATVEEKATFGGMYAAFTKKIAPYRHRISIIKDYSVKASQMIRDSELDFIFIDGNHEYSHVKEDIIAWRSKVKKGGIISGHDYVTDTRAIRYGVKKAVDELFPMGIQKIGTIWFVVNI